MTVTSETSAMAKKKERAKQSPGDWAKKPVIVHMRGSAEFKEWLERAAAADRNTVAAFIERAAVLYARSIGFAEEAPER